MMAAGTAHMRMREHSTVTRSDQAELRRDARRTGPAVKSLRASPPGRVPAASQDKYRTSAPVPVDDFPPPAELALERRRGSEPSMSRPPRITRPAVRRSRGPLREEADRPGRMGREDPPTPAPRGSMGHRRQLRGRAVPAEVRRDELAAPRPLRPGSQGDAPADRQSSEAVPPTVWRSGGTWAVGRARFVSPATPSECSPDSDPSTMRRCNRRSIGSDYQKSDGGWHCFRSRTGTLDGWEALAGFAAIPEAKRSAAMHRAIERGAEFYLERGLLREGRTPYAPWMRLHYPVHYYYDLLVGVDVLTSLGYGDDPRMRLPLGRLAGKRNRDGTWNLDALHPDTEDPNYQIRGPFYPFGLEVPGRPSRWITATALIALQRAGR